MDPFWRMVRAFAGLIQIRGAYARCTATFPAFPLLKHLGLHSVGRGDHAFKFGMRAEIDAVIRAGLTARPGPRDREIT